MTERNVKVVFSKSGNGIGAKLALSVPLLKEIGITQEEREVLVVYNKDTNSITVTKKK